MIFSRFDHPNLATMDVALESVCKNKCSRAKSRIQSFRRQKPAALRKEGVDYAQRIHGSR
jgi:hypothetical protein